MTRPEHDQATERPFAVPELPPASRVDPPMWEPAGPDGPYWMVELDEDDRGVFFILQAPEDPTIGEARAFFLAGLAACAAAEQRGEVSSR